MRAEINCDRNARELKQSSHGAPHERWRDLRDDGFDGLVVHERMKNAKLKNAKVKNSVLTFAFYIFNFAFSVAHDDGAGEVVVCGAAFGVEESVDDAEAHSDERQDVEERA